MIGGHRDGFDRIQRPHHEMQRHTVQRINSPAFRRFWTMLAHYHGQVWSSSEFACPFGMADTTVRRYLDTLTAALVVRQLPRWHENIGKRQVNTPNV